MRRGETQRASHYPKTALIMLLAGWSFQCHHAASESPNGPLRSPAATGSPVVSTSRCDWTEERVRRDPLGFLRQCRDHYDRTVKDYKARFVKQERIAGVLRNEQETDVRFRENPFSVDMRWIRNPGRAARINFVAGRWVEDGRELALIEPSGLLGMVVPGGVKRDIRGPEALAESRRAIDQFGFRNSLGLIIKYCEQAAGSDGYSLTCHGTTEYDSRTCYLFERTLPYRSEGGAFPDRRLLVYIDSEWLVPIGVFAFADDASQELLAKYCFSSIEFNTGLTDADF